MIGGPDEETLGHTDGVREYNTIVHNYVNINEAREWHTIVHNYVNGLGQMCRAT